MLAMFTGAWKRNSVEWRKEFEGEVKIEVEVILWRDLEREVKEMEASVLVRIDDAQAVAYQALYCP